MNKIARLDPSPGCAWAMKTQQQVLCYLQDKLPSKAVSLTG